MDFEEEVTRWRLQLGLPGEPATPARDAWLDQLPVQCLLSHELWRWRSAAPRIVELWHIEWLQDG